MRWGTDADRMAEWMRMGSGHEEPTSTFSGKLQ